MHRPNPFRSRPPVGLSALVGLLVAVVVACSSPTVSRRVAIVDADGRAQFNARSITVTQGDTLKLTVGNRTDAPQDFTVDGTDVDHALEPDQAVTVEIKAETPGTYRVYSASDQSLDPLSIIVPA
jgi:hypothetical protein